MSLRKFWLDHDLISSYTGVKEEAKAAFWLDHDLISSYTREGWRVSGRQFWLDHDLISSYTTRPTDVVR